MDTVGLIHERDALEKRVEELERYLKCTYHHEDEFCGGGFCSKCGWQQSEFLKKDEE